MNPRPTTPTHAGLHGSVLEALGGRIVNDDLPAGHVLTLDGITQEYGVSRSVAREAIRVLESMGLVVSRRRIGVTVQARPSWHMFSPLLIRWRLDGEDRHEQLGSLSELRRGFEPTAASLAADRATPEQTGILTDAVTAMRTEAENGDLEAYLAADVRFHRTLIAGSGNEMMLALADVVEEALAGRTHHHLMPARPSDEAIALHQDVADAVRSGDAEAAERAMRAIISEASDAMRAQHDAQSPGSGHDSGSDQASG